MERVREGATRTASQSTRRRSDTAKPHCRGQSSLRVPTTPDHVRNGRNGRRRSDHHRKLHHCSAKPPGSGADARRGRRTRVRSRPRARHAQPGRAPRRSARPSTPAPKRAGATPGRPARCASSQGIGRQLGRQEWRGAADVPAFLPASGQRGGTLQALLIACACILLPGHWIHPSTAGRPLGIALAELLHGRRERAQRSDHTGWGDVHNSIVQDSVLVCRDATASSSGRWQSCSSPIDHSTDENTRSTPQCRVRGARRLRPGVVKFQPSCCDNKTVGHWMARVLQHSNALEAGAQRVPARARGTALDDCRNCRRRTGTAPKPGRVSGVSVFAAPLIRGLDGVLQNLPRGIR